MITDITVIDAARRTVHAHGGVSLAKPMGIRPRVLLNKVNANTHNRLTLDESVRLQRITGDCAILQAMAQTLGYAVIPLESPIPSDVELLTQYARWQDASGRVHHAIADALEDQRITPEEQAEIERRFHAAASAGLGYLRRMGGLVQ